MSSDATPDPLGKAAASRATVRVAKIGRRRPPKGAGSKAAGLSWLYAHAFPTPATWAVLWHDGIVEAEALRSALRPIVQDGVAYAVRSSADVEDGAERSFAGQFDSFLDVRGLDGVADAVGQVLAGADSERVAAYRADRSDGRDSEVRMGVLVQEMVTPEISGVAFSANPVTGLAETIIEAVSGSGEALVQHGATPERWVYAWGRWKSTPAKAALPQSAAESIVEDIISAAAKYGQPIDVEWVWDGTRVTYVQLRPITTIGSVSYYSNRFSREVLPGVILPLVWSVNIPIVNGAWIRLLDQLVGPTGLKAHDLAARIYSRAYFNMGALGTVFDTLGIPRESLEILSGIEGADGHMPRPRLNRKTLRQVPRVTVFAARTLAHERTANKALDSLELRFTRLQDSLTVESATAAEILVALDGLRPIVEETAYLNVLTPLLSEAYNHVLARRLKRHGITYDAVNFANRDPGDEGRDPTAALDGLRRERDGLTAEARTALDSGGVDALRARTDGASFVKLFDRFTDRYGHFSDSGNDFSHVPWREDPDVVLRLVASMGAARDSATRLTLDDLPGGGGTRRGFGRAARFQVLRERISSFYTLCYGFHRPLYRGLSAVLEDGVWPPLPDACFYLEDAELRSLAARDLSSEAACATAVTRAEEVEAVRDMVVPDVVFGDEPAPFQDIDAERLSGVATSSGRHTGHAVLIASASEARPVLDGDVLVVPYSDVAWTPLFARAGAIVAESGGFLSHTSIVAREYGIPAVVSVTGAMRLLHDGDRVTVDGYAGTVTLSDTEEASS